MLAFNHMLANTATLDMSTLFVIMLLVQISAPVIYSFTQGGVVTPERVLGILFAIGACLLLSK